MENVQIVRDIWKRKLIKKDQEISDILDKYTLSETQREAVDDYVNRIDRSLKEREEGRPAVKAYWDEHGPRVDKAQKYLALAGAVAGGLVGLVDGNFGNAVAGVVIGGLTGYGIELFFKPLARVMGVPGMSHVEGSLPYLIKAREDVTKVFSE